MAFVDRAYKSFVQTEGAKTVISLIAMASVSTAIISNVKIMDMFTDLLVTMGMSCEMIMGECIAGGVTLNDVMPVLTS